VSIEKFKSAVEMKAMSEQNRIANVDLEARVVRQLESIYEFIELAVRRSDSKVNAILYKEGKYQEDIYRKVIEFLEEKGYQVDSSMAEEQLLKISWE
jgi:NCAIR mutase (PurE)-related protein